MYADLAVIGSEYEIYLCDSDAMARRTELKGICSDLLSTFISRNNDLNGYWTLGQCRSWIEEGSKREIKIALVGDMAKGEKPQIAAISRYYNAALMAILSAYKLDVDWIDEGYISIKIENSERLRCSVCLTSDLGRMFQSTCFLEVRSHDPNQELRRHFDSWGIRTETD